MKKRIIVDIPFNIDLYPYNYTEPTRYRERYKQAFIDAQTKEWIAYRIELFMRYTAKSLINQTSQNFICIMRHTKHTKSIIDEELKKYPPLPDNIIFTSKPKKVITQELRGMDYLYHVRIDADNMYDFNFIKTVDEFEYEEGLECLLCQKGYVYDSNNGRLGTVDHESPSLFVYIFRKQDYFNIFGDRLFGNHFDAAKMNHKVLDNYNYLLTVHKNNISNSFDAIIAYFKGKEIMDENLKKEILRKYKIIE